MAQALTLETILKSREQTKRPNIALKIDGIDQVFGSSFLQKTPRFDEDNLFFDQPGLFFDGLVNDSNSRDYISLSGSTTSITQQLKQDKGSVSSVTNVNVKLLDGSGELSELFAPGVNVSDLLGTGAKLYLLFDGTRYPEDAILFLSGTISEFKSDAASFTIRIAHPDQLKRQEIFLPVTQQLDAAITDSQTTISLDDVSDYVIPEPTEGFQTYVQIDDELMEYTATNVGDNDMFVTRGQLNTFAAAHDDEADVDVFYRLKGNAIELALKLMLSNPEPDFTSTAYLDNTPEPSLEGDTFLRYPGKRLESNEGVTVGDLIHYHDGTTSTTTYEIISVVENEIETRIFIDGPIVVRPPNTRFFSRYNVWPIGLAMKPSQVDVIEHERILDLFGNRFPEMDIYIKEEKVGKEFIEGELMFPNGLYTIPRKGRSSLGITVPPLADFQTVTLDEDAIINPDQVSITRTTNSNFYNAVVYKFDEDSIEDKFLKGLSVFSQRSVNRINVKNKPLVIEAGGFRDDPQTRTRIRRQADAFIGRYQFAADLVKNVKITLEAGFNIDVGDRVIFGSAALKLYDSKKGSRDFSPRVMECVNKKFDFAGNITVDLLDTNFTTLARFGVVSPSSEVKSFSDGVITLKPSFSTNPVLGESPKWNRYIEEFVVIHNPDYSIAGTSRIVADVASNANQLIITDPGITVTDGMIMDVANYADAGDLTKSLHCYFSIVLTITGGTSQTIFNVADASGVFIGSVLNIYKPDYSEISQDVVVTAIDGTQITVDNEIGFIPANNDQANLVGFASDNGLPYRLLG